MKPLPKREGGFVETSVVSRINSTIDMAREMFWNAAIIGAPGIGKTLALKRYAQADEMEVGYIEARPIVARSMAAFLQELAETVDVRSGGSNRDIEREFKRTHFNRSIIIVDEAQNIPLVVVRQLLHLSVADDGPFVFVFVGNDEMLQKVSVSLPAMMQINRRIRLRETISNIEDEDADAISQTESVEGIEAFKLLRRVGSAFHVDGIVTVAQVARRFADGPTIRIEHIRDALDNLPQFQSVLRRK